MIRLFIRLGFWSSLALLAMPSSRELLIQEGIAPTTIARAASLASADIGNFCARNLGVCQTGQVVAAQASQQVKSRVLSAYNEIRTQFDEPDRSIMTGSVKK